MNNYLLSIIVPIKNEIHYLKDLLFEISLIDAHDVEVIISDNYSDDGSWEFLSGKNSIIKLVRPEKSCSPFENHKYALSKATGKYIYPMGGDDIFLAKSLDKILPLLKKHENIIVIGRVKTFKDVTNEITGVTNNPNTIKSFFVNDIFSIKKYLLYVNYDEMIFSFVPRNKQEFMNKLDPINYETFAVWSNFYNFHERSMQEIYFIDEVVMMKRYFKQHESGNFTLDQGMSKSSNNIRKFKGTIKNILNFMKICFDLKIFFYLMFYNRQAIGSYGKRRVYSPFIRVVGVEVVRILRKIINFKKNITMLK